MDVSLADLGVVDSLKPLDPCVYARQTLIQRVNICMSKRILSVSYDESLLTTRQLLLAYRGYVVTSTLGFTDAIAQSKTNSFDLFILGQSIPISDKQELIRTFRQYCSAPILSLDRAGESHVDSDFHVAANDPEQFLKTVAEVVSPRTRSATL